MQSFPPTPKSGTGRSIRLVARLMQLSVYLLPLLPVLYLACWQDPGLLFQAPLLHELASVLASLEGAALGFVCWLCYQRSGEVLVKRMAQGFMAYTVVYSLHGMFTPVAQPFMALFVLYGPAARLLMGVLLWFAVRAHNRAVDPVAQRGSLRFWWRFLGYLMLGNVLVAALATSPVGALPWPLQGMEAGALLFYLVSLVQLCTVRARTPLMRYYMQALAWFAATSLAFLLSAPWNHLWWLAHGLSAVGFSILGFGVLKAYLTTDSLERVFSTEELFDDLVKVNARLVDAFHEYDATNTELQGKLLELERSRHAFVALLAALPDAVLIVEQGGTILDANSRAEHLFGYAAGGLLGTPVDRLWPPAQRGEQVQKWQQLVHASQPLGMGDHKAPLHCLRRDGSEFMAEFGSGNLTLEGQQCLVVQLRTVSWQQEAIVRQRESDLALIERGQLLDAVLAIAPTMLFSLQRNANGSYTCTVCNQACTQGLHVGHDATPQDWVQQWFNRVLPRDLPGLISAIETAALSRQALQLQWSHHLSGQGTRALQLFSGTPVERADGGLVWMCRVMPGVENKHGR